MRLLLDTHAVLWWFSGNERLSRPARAAVDDEDTEVFVSAVSAFEIALKHRSGRLPEAERLMVSYQSILAEEGFTPLAVSTEHALAAGALRISHRDPFDRLLIAQAIVEGMTLVSNERIFDAAGVSRLW